jgi:4'-phosphopantetheinyl transferase EntD
MKDLDFRKQNAKEIDEHVLTQDELERLIEEKFRRARAYQLAFGKREEELVEYD